MTSRFISQWYRLFITVVCYTAPNPVFAAAKQLLTPEACTEIRYLMQDELTNRSPLVLSPDGRYIAYVLQAPDISSNSNKESLYIQPIDDTSMSRPIPVATEHLVTAVSWFPDERHLAALVRRENRIVLVRIDSATTKRAIIWETAGDVTDYSMDSAGKTIAIAVRERHQSPSLTQAPRDHRQGYRLDLSTTAHSDLPRRQIYILRSTDQNHWEVSEPITFVSPISGRIIDDIADNHTMHINLSPNGHLLLIDNIEKFSDVPQNSIWTHSTFVQREQKSGSVGLLVSYLYDLTTKRASMPLKSPYVLDSLWAPDSKSYTEVSVSPVGSGWETTDLEKGLPSIHSTHLFSVNVQTGNVKEVLKRSEEPPVGWTRTGALIVRDPANVLITLRNDSGEWKRFGETHIPFSGLAPYSPMATDGVHTITEYQDASTAPQIAGFDMASGRKWVVAKLNPQVDFLILPKTEPITWTTSTGFEAKGLLLLPPDYDPKRRYPLVIENGSILYSGEFVCDSGVTHVPSFTRGILADSGIIYLMRYWPGIDDWETNYYPKGYPGNVAEAAFKQDLVESAVKLLEERRMIDVTKVGLVGFSRGGWYVEYMLTHSPISFAAASATDNVLYSTGEYWFQNNEKIARTQEGMYGGPPYGPSLKNWLDYSISFNLDKIHTPLLMEVMGYGKEYDNPDQPPDNVAVHNEIFVGLKRLDKAVEYYYYPNEQHEPEHPQARVASLQRNVDWFRFWLQGYERSHPDDPNQYRRWKVLQTGEGITWEGPTGQAKRPAIP